MFVIEFSLKCSGWWRYIGGQSPKQSAFTDFLQKVKHFSTERKWNKSSEKMTHFRARVLLRCLMRSRCLSSLYQLYQNISHIEWRWLGNNGYKFTELHLNIHVFFYVCISISFFLFRDSFLSLKYLSFILFIK